MNEKPTTGAVFEARFADGTRTRMSVWTRFNQLDLRRALKLSMAAYESRKRQPAVPIVAGRFELGAEVLREYSNREELEVAAATAAD